MARAARGAEVTTELGSKMDSGEFNKGHVMVGMQALLQRAGE